MLPRRGGAKARAGRGFRQARARVWGRRGSAGRSLGSRRREPRAGGSRAGGDPMAVTLPLGLRAAGAGSGARPLPRSGSYDSEPAAATASAVNKPWARHFRGRSLATANRCPRKIPRRTRVAAPEGSGAPRRLLSRSLNPCAAGRGSGWGPHPSGENALQELPLASGVPLV